MSSSDNLPHFCRSVGCMHNVPAGEDFCAECTDLVKPGQEKLLVPQPCTREAPLSATDPVVEANRALLLQRSQTGLRKYGTTLYDGQYTQRELLQHALEEALDLANYLQAEIMRLDADALQTA